MLTLSLPGWLGTKHGLSILNFKANANVKVKAQAWLAHSKTTATLQFNFLFYSGYDPIIY